MKFTTLDCCVVEVLHVRITRSKRKLKKLASKVFFADQRGLELARVTLDIGRKIACV